jgi:hypothetical protein
MDFTLDYKKIGENQSTKWHRGHSRRLQIKLADNLDSRCSLSLILNSNLFLINLTSLQSNAFQAFGKEVQGIFSVKTVRAKGTYKYSWFLSTA